MGFDVGLTNNELTLKYSEDYTSSIDNIKSIGFEYSIVDMSPGFMYVGYSAVIDETIIGYYTGTVPKNIISIGIMGGDDGYMSGMTLKMSDGSVDNNDGEFLSYMTLGFSARIIF